MSKDMRVSTCPFATSRRGFLVGAGAVATAAARWRNRRPPARRGDAPVVTDAPLAHEDSKRRVPFYGLRQSGVVTPRPASGMVAAFDVVASKPEDLKRLLLTLTERIAFLTQGGAAPVRDPKFPPPDSGMLGPVISPDDLTVTVSVGASLFEDRPWLKPLQPKRLQRMAEFPNDALVERDCHGDVALQFCANSQATNIHALRDILKNTSDLMVLRWRQEGSVPVMTPAPGGKTESARNFLGFRDGSANPDSNDAALMDRLVWVDSGSEEPIWTRNGTYQAIRIIRMFVEQWDRTPLGEQQRIIGRDKSSGAPLGALGATEHDPPDYAADPKGFATPLDAHIRLANPRRPETEANLILRRPFNFSNGVSKSGQLEDGLLFIAYQADLEKGFITCPEPAERRAARGIHQALRRRLFLCPARRARRERLSGPGLVESIA